MAPPDLSLLCKKNYSLLYQNKIPVPLNLTPKAEEETQTLELDVQTPRNKLIT